MKVLVIDDSPTARSAIRLQLASLGCKTVAEADTTSAALQKLRTERCQLITLDLVMPTIAGISPRRLFDLIRHDFPDTAVVVITSLAHEKVKFEYMQAGALDYIVKPLNQLSLQRLQHKLSYLFEDFR